MNTWKFGRYVAVLVLLALGMVACTDETHLAIVTAQGRHGFTVEIADTAEARSQGLMFRQELARDAGMLFDFQEERVLGFWMRNTFIPLDMLFIGANGVIRHIHANARPHDPTTISSEVPARFVLEIPGGQAAAIGITPGDRIDHPRIER